MIGITAFGAYIPKGRLQKKSAADANSWFDASLNSLAKGERSMCNWDEDTITMAVEAGRDCLGASSSKKLSSLYLASTTLPFLDRQNSVVVGEALNLDNNVRSMDISASQRAATSGLIALLEGNVKNERQAMLIASEHRRSKAGSRQEMLWGDAAAAITVGSDDLIAEFLGAETVAVDFVDHYRGEDADFDYDWEERWIREEGYLKSVPLAVNRLLKAHSISSTAIKHFILPSDQARAPGAVAAKLGIATAAVIDNQIANCGVAGVAQPLLLLVKTLQQADADDLILLTGFGQGCDALLFRATGKKCSARGTVGSLDRRREETNYNKFLSFNNLVARDLGKRGEADKQTYLSSLNRRKDLLTSLRGGKCRVCGTVQIPSEKYCVNPDCNALDSQDAYGFSDKTGVVKTWTADRLTFDWNPPAYFGLVDFEGGGRLMMDFTEVEEGKIDSGSAVTVHFRIKQFDKQRGFRKYFWKAIPIES